MSRVDFTPAGNPIKHGGAGTAYANYGCRCEECKEANRVRTKRRRGERDARLGEFTHGRAGYVNWNCRCEICSRAHSEMCKINARKRAERGLPEGDPRHGRHSTYSGWGCRCEPCIVASSEYRREHPRGK